LNAHDKSNNCSEGSVELDDNVPSTILSKSTPDGLAMVLMYVMSKLDDGGFVIPEPASRDKSDSIATPRHFPLIGKFSIAGIL
jgi:hypothetical protein